MSWEFQILTLREHIELFCFADYFVSKTLVWLDNECIHKKFDPHCTSNGLAANSKFGSAWVCQLHKVELGSVWPMCATSQCLEKYL